MREQTASALKAQNRSRAYRSEIAICIYLLTLGGTAVAVGSQQDPPRSSVAPSFSIASINSNNCERIGKLVDQLQASTQELNAGLLSKPPLGASGKFRLAVQNFADPLGIAGTAVDSGISTVTSSKQSAFGTGWAGFGSRFGMSMADTGLSEFFSTFLVSTLAHQDPHYHRKPEWSVGRRIGYALSRVAIARSDSGSPMFNYAEFAGTTAASLVETTFHFEREETPRAVTARIIVSIGSDAAWNLLSEFLPDVAKHVNPRFIYLRRLAERAASQH